MKLQHRQLLSTAVVSCGVKMQLCLSDMVQGVLVRWLRRQTMASAVLV